MPNLNGLSSQVQSYNSSQLTQLKNTQAKDRTVDATNTNKTQVIQDLQNAINTNSSVQIVTGLKGNSATTVNISRDQAIKLLDAYKKGNQPLSQIEIHTEHPAPHSTENHGGEQHHSPSVAGTVAHDGAVNVAHHAAEHGIHHVAEHAAERAAEHALERGAEHAAEHAVTRAVEHGAGEALAHGAAHVGGRLAAVAAPGVGAVAAGYLAVQGVKHSMHAAEKGHTGAAICFALAATVDGTTAVVNGAGAVSGAGVVISTPVSIGLGVVATGLSALGAWLDD